jgi:xylan 1,4-beta-xylosidase
VDAAAGSGELHPIWRFFGADEPNYAHMKDGRKLLAELGQLGPHQVYFRTHNLLNTGDGTPALKWGSTNAYTEDAQGKPVYDWTIIDRIFDTYKERGLKPYAQIGFMPQALSVKPEPYQHEWRPGLPYNKVYTGWAHPPKDYAKWAELVYQWVKHSVERYGRAEVERWYWEVWNEPNIAYWQGTPEEFNKLHDHAVDAPRPGWADRTPRAEAVRSCAVSWSTACAAPTTPPARPARLSTFSLSMRRGHRSSREVTCRWASRATCRRSTGPWRSSPRSPS